MKPTWLICALLSVSAPAEAAQTADGDYQSARASYYALKQDREKRKLRHHWLSVARKFDAVAAKYSKSSRAPDALFTAAELYSELSRFSGIEEDLTAAIFNYQRLWENYPGHNLADDALLATIRIFMDRRTDPVKAYSAMKRGFGRVKLGDKKKEVLALKAEIPVPVSHPLPIKPGPRMSAVKTSSPKLTENAHPVPVPESSEAKAEEFGDGGSTDSVAEEEIAAQEKVPSALTQWQEHLRDVRVGPESSISEDTSAEAEEAKKRLRGFSAGTADVSLATQLGLKVRRVVLDAGHGGHDSGAIGPTGVKEKDVTLAITRKLAQILRASGLEVQLTRDSDEYLKLEDRTKFGNDAKGDLFISIHCNASPNRKSRGVETYTLNTSADRYAIRLAARENASSEQGISDLQYILADLATKANTDESNRLAEKVQGALVGELREQNSGVRNLGRKEALFFVLLGARMPAILVETSFISNPEEEKLLVSSEYQSAVAQAIAGGVHAFISDREKIAQTQTN